jgi:acyl-CoA synthetase (AMP-forming)/AMP-acid ligase II
VSAAGSRVADAATVAAARNTLDAHVREIVAWHFSPETGTPFWLERAADLGIDPVRQVRGFADLEIFGLFEDEWLRGGPVRRWVPKGMAGKPLMVFETGGTTGLPKNRVASQDVWIDYESFSDTLSDETFPRDSDWLMVGPTGPRRLRVAIERLAQHRGGIAFHVDLDPRWVNRLVRAAKWDELDAYKAHVVEQALKVLKGHEIRCLFTTPKLLESLCERVDLNKVGISGIFCGGTEMTPQFHRFAREELVPGIDFVPTYGNTLMGLACHKPFDPANPEWPITYHAPQPRAVLQIVDPDDPTKVVDYGATGRVKLTTLTHEFFMPGFLERDEAERTEPIVLYPWDGVQNVRPFSRIKDAITVGVY